jgi:hypothetical protein
MELRVETTYVDDDGVIQRSTETVTDRVLTARAGQVDAASLLALVAATQWPESNVGPASPEYSPAHVNVFWRINNESRAWSGASDGLPDVAQAVVSEADRLVARASLAVMTAQRFMRATRLAQGTVEEFRREGLLHELSGAQLAAAPLLSEAVEWEQRLVPVAADADPYAVIGKGFQAGHSIEVLTDRGAFQIRNLSAQEASSKQEEQRCRPVFALQPRPPAAASSGSDRASSRR